MTRMKYERFGGQLPVRLGRKKRRQEILGIGKRNLKQNHKYNRRSNKKNPQCLSVSFACFEVMTYYRENLANKILPYLQIKVAWASTLQ